MSDNTKRIRSYPRGPVVKALPSNAGGEVRSLLGELRSHMPQCGQNRKKRFRLNGVQGRGAETLPRAGLTPSWVLSTGSSSQGTAFKASKSVDGSE